MHLDIVRPGIILYGLYPSREVAGKIDLRPAMTLKANVIFVKDVDKDTYVSYGRTFRTDCKSRIATIPIGYADGYTRLMSNKGRMLVNGEYAPVIGQDLHGPVHARCDRSGSMMYMWVTRLSYSEGRTGSCISVDEIADQVGTINYELVCIIGKRIPRVYLKEGKICGVRII